MESLTPPKQTALPNLPVGSNSQVFIHPEHESGNLVFPKQSAKTKGGSSFNSGFLVFAGLFLLGFGLLLILFFIPKTQAVSFATNTHEAVATSSNNLDKVNDSLSILYAALQSTEPSDVVVSKSENVLNATTNTLETDIFTSAENSIQKINTTFSEGSKVKGFATPIGDLAAEERQKRELASDIATKVSDDEQNLSDVIALKEVNVPSSAEVLQKRITELGENTSTYLDQAQKTSDFYVDVSEASIDLVTLGSTTNTPKDLDNTIGKITALKSKFENNKNLPEKMEAYNKDLVDMFDLLAVFFTSLKANISNPKLNVDQLYAQFNIQLESISTRAALDEVSFWKTNESLSEYDRLSDEHAEIIKLSLKLKEQNSFFLLNWVGVK